MTEQHDWMELLNAAKPIPEAVQDVLWVDKNVQCRTPISISKAKRKLLASKLLQDHFMGEIEKYLRQQGYRFQKVELHVA